ncbi:MAG: hypothetical protein CVT66_02935 [Actinobacteria bacterium HGW-Actinobacteria-6]|nr:MAG: hypothetical protein CVT66_02935 [Actinobacteria bacterium HGW-Actinobacteria-6]
MSLNAGFFPTDERSLDEFAELYIQAVQQADVMGLWFNSHHGSQGGQRRVIREYCSDARLVEFSSYLSMLYEEPWTAQLEGKRVLVVHPFAATIESQYLHSHDALFKNEAVLPRFELTTLVPPQSAAGSVCSFANWFDALSETCDRIAQVSFDVALIGAGAYGLPIAAFVKSQGRQAVHIGGATQLLFGIRGRRWDSDEGFASMYNEYWVRPSSDETPEGALQVEGGCYW